MKNRKLSNLKDQIRTTSAFTRQDIEAAFKPDMFGNPSMPMLVADIVQGTANHMQAELLATQEQVRALTQSANLNMLRAQQFFERLKASGLLHEGEQF